MRAHSINQRQAAAGVFALIGAAAWVAHSGHSLGDLFGAALLWAGLTSLAVLGLGAAASLIARHW